MAKMGMRKILGVPASVSTKVTPRLSAPVTAGSVKKHNPHHAPLVQKSMGKNGGARNT